ncbi:MAG: winged helix-turn-helix domain-containing protein, partial [Ilumatobacteraceae bacterium]
MELRLFGGVRGVRDCAEVALGGPRQRFVLAILAMECGHVVSSDRLVEILWPESGDKKLASLHVHISNLRR